jgi:hypothetical protein
MAVGVALTFVLSEEPVFEVCPEQLACLLDCRLTPAPRDLGVKLKMHLFNPGAL